MLFLGQQDKVPISLRKLQSLKERDNIFVTHFKRFMSSVGANWLWAKNHRQPLFVLMFSWDFFYNIEN